MRALVVATLAALALGAPGGPALQFRPPQGSQSSKTCTIQWDDEVLAHSCDRKHANVCSHITVRGDFLGFHNDNVDQVLRDDVTNSSIHTHRRA